MNVYVVDASVLAKWYVPEDLSDESLRYAKPAHDLIAPDLILPEFGNILWKKVNRREITRELGNRIIERVSAAPPLTLHPTQPLLPLALTIGMGISRSVYDSLYLALAVIQECKMVTADERLVNSLKGGPLERHAVWVAVPPA